MGRKGSIYELKFPTIAQHATGLAICPLQTLTAARMQGSIRAIYRGDRMTENSISYPRVRTDQIGPQRMAVHSRMPLGVIGPSSSMYPNTAALIVALVPIPLPLPTLTLSQQYYIYSYSHIAFYLISQTLLALL